MVDFKNHNPKFYKSVEINRLIEKPPLENSPSNFAMVGRYILPPCIFNVLEETTPGVGDEIQLTDALDKFLDSSNELQGFLTDASIFDCGKLEGFLGANLALAMQNTNMKKFILNLMKELD